MKVTVTGDATIDWLLFQKGGDRAALDFAWIWGEGLTCRAVAQAGGAAFAGGLVERALAADTRPRGRIEFAGPSIPPRALATPAYRGLTTTFSTWALHPCRCGRDELVWRMGAYLGDEPIEGDTLDLLPATVDPPDVLLLHDQNIGFRHAPERWTRLLRPPGEHQTIVLSSLAPLAEGPLWERLIADRADDLTVVITGEDLRKEGVQVSYALSWEQVHVNVIDAIRGHPLSVAARVVVMLGAAGAVIVERDGSNQLLFDPHHQEGDWVGDYPGLYWGFGLLPCVAGALLIELAHDSAVDVPCAVIRGLHAARALHIDGYPMGKGGRPNPRAFLDRAASLLTHSDAQGAVDTEGTFARLDLASAPAPDYTILLASRRSAQAAAMAREAAILGSEHLSSGIPVETVGAWVSVDRTEIESVRSVRSIVREYIRQYRAGVHLGRPLSIGVFGPPGSGKSFAVGEIAQTLLGGEMTTVTFNLSQFQSVNELPAAFHRVRDLVLQQRLPFVFWDEFDADVGDRRLGWLSTFLAPMQDGEFLESGAPHPIGPAVFVFAGGTCATLQEFASSGDEAHDRAAKKPDFLSRLRGYLNIYGPNRLSQADSAYPLRRAFLLRSLLVQKAPQTVRDGRLSIDEGVLRAFLETERFIHGARSIEAIIDQSALAGKARFGRSSLPPADQLALHVDAEEFLTLVRG
jgi:hypothetical protein